MKEISRRSFLKGALATTATAAVAGVVGIPAAAALAEGVYKPGTYTATAKGINTITATMTFSADAITDVVLDLSGETPATARTSPKRWLTHC